MNTIQFDCILLDDDILVRKTWEISARRAQIKICTVASFADLEPLLSQLDKATKIYIDYSLEGKTGLEISRILFGLGFSNLYLATGMLARDLPPLSETPWLKGIHGKEPYWL